MKALSALRQTLFLLLALFWPSQSTAELIISELMASNSVSLLDGQGDSPDWVEVYNRGAETVELEGYHLTDDTENPTKWPFPSQALGPGEHLIIFCSDKDTPPEGELHATFKLGASGEYLALITPDGTRISEFSPSFPEQSTDISYGIRGVSTDNIYGYLEAPTPSEENSASFLPNEVADTKFTPGRKLFSGTMVLTITSETVGATIHYTTDGSTPTTDSPVYSAPLSLTETTTVRAFGIKDGLTSTNIDTHTYISLESAANQPNEPAGFSTRWGVANSIRADYEVDQEVISSALPSHSFNDALTSLPSLAINTAEGDLFGSQTGIYYHADKSGDEWDKQASVELISPTGGDEFQINCGVAVHGASSRNHQYTPKHSLRLLFQEKFGPTKLDFPLFKDSPVEKFDRLILRACSSDSWPARDGIEHFGVIRSSGARGTLMRDQWMRDSQIDLGHNSAHGRYVHLYLNGLYWGVYNITERLNSSFHSEHFGGDREEWDVMHDRGEVQSGDTVAWDAMFTLADAGLSDDASYMELQGNDPDGTPNPALPTYLDIDHFIDYMILHITLGAEDWPCHNYWVARPRNDDSVGFRFYVWDQEHSMDSLVRERTWCNVHFEIRESDVSFLNTQADLQKSPAKLYYQLRQNAQFREKFSARVHELLFNFGELSPEKSHDRWLRRKDELDQAIVGESARWGDHRVTPARKRETHWLPETSWLKETFWHENQKVALERFQRVNLYPSITPPSFQEPSGAVGQSGIVHFGKPSEGTVYYTTDGSDPKAPDGNVAPTAVGVEVALEEISLFDFEATGWRYHATDSGLSDSEVVSGHPNYSQSDWKHPDFDDTSWPEGQAMLGYGAITGSTVNTTVPFGDDESNRYPTTYFRKEFNIDNPDGIFELSFQLKRDDGTVVYLNGIELHRSNVADGNLKYEDRATDSARPESEILTFSTEPQPGDLRTGKNIIAIELRQRTASSSDMGVDLAVAASATDPATIPPLTLTESGTVKVRVRSQENEWSELNEAFISLGEPASRENLVLSKIHYRPAAPSEAEIAAGFDRRSSFEYLELYNRSNATLSLGGVAIREAVDFTFPRNQPAELGPGERGVLVSNTEAFRHRFGDTPRILGVFQEGRLSDDGEGIVVSDSQGQDIWRFIYNDAGGWPDTPDGEGKTLALRNPNALQSDSALSSPESWKPSLQIGGSPGLPDGISFSTWLAEQPSQDPLSDPDGDGLNQLLSFALNGTTLPSNIPSILPFTEVTELEVDDLTQLYLTFSVRLSLESTDINVTPQFSQTLGSWTPLDFVLHHNQDLGDGAHLLLFRSPTPVEASPKLSGYFRILVEKSP